MPNYIRNYVYGGTFFFTLVTKNGEKIFIDQTNVVVLMNAINTVKARKPFALIAYCIIPDHVHLLLTLPEDQNSFSQRIRDIKRVTTLALRKVKNNPKLMLWQKRFWEHTIRDQRDMQNCFNYIHYNPVKHGYSEFMDGWKWSSFSDYFNGLNPNEYEVDTQILEEYQKYCGE